MLQTYWRRWCLRPKSKLLIHSKEVIALSPSLNLQPCLLLFSSCSHSFQSLKKAIRSHLLAFLHLMKLFSDVLVPQVNVSSLGKLSSCTLIFKTGLGSFRGSLTPFPGMLYLLMLCVSSHGKTDILVSMDRSSSSGVLSCLVLAHKSPLLHFQEFCEPIDIPW